MDLPPELKQGIFLLLAEKELEVVEEVFPDIVNDSYFKARYQYLHYTFAQCIQQDLTGGLKLYLIHTKTDVIPLHFLRCVIFHSVPTVEVLLNDPRIDLTLTDTQGRSILHICILSFSVVRSIFQLLLKQPKIDINLTDAIGRTPLHLALMYGRTNIVEILLKDPRLDPTLLYRGQTALDIARHAGRRPEIIALLEGNYNLTKNLISCLRYTNKRSPL